jgi:hypothetical protein
MVKPNSSVPGPVTNKNSSLLKKTKHATGDRQHKER